MNKGLMFLLGLGAGSLIGAFFFKKKYEQQANMEIESVKKAYKEHFADKKEEFKPDNEDKEKADKAKEKPDLNQYAEILKKEKKDYTEYSMPKKESKTEEHKAPYVISPDAFGEGEYDYANLTYYADGVLADDMDEEVTNLKNTVGEDFEEHFGDYEEDVVHIRNERLKLDYEITRDLRNYQEVIDIYKYEDR